MLCPPLSSARKAVEESTQPRAARHGSMQPKQRQVAPPHAPGVSAAQFPPPHPNHTARPRRGLCARVSRWRVRRVCGITGLVWQVLLREGELPPAFYILVHGTVRVEKGSAWKRGDLGDDTGDVRADELGELVQLVPLLVEKESALGGGIGGRIGGDRAFAADISRRRAGGGPGTRSSSIPSPASSEAVSWS